MKQRFERRTQFLSTRRGRWFWLLLTLFSLALPYPGCVKRSRDTSLSIKSNAQSSPAISLEANDQQPGNSPQGVTFGNQTNTRININTAPAAELEKLPGIGKGLAERIIDHRERFGPFRRPEHLIIVRGISDRRFRAFKDLITVE
jgi:competence ComEA-like helix-hairpin-helix protein